jgi:PadR family transcriptional regulator PadR
MGADKSSELRPGTLDLHVLKALCPRRMHGYRTAQHLKTISEDVLQVGESSLYPVLQRALLNQSKVEWGTSENNRSAVTTRLVQSGESSYRRNARNLIAWSS